MTDRKKLQEKVFKYKILEETTKTLTQRRDLFMNRIIEIENTLNSIEDIQKSDGEEIFLPLGSGVYVPGIVKKKDKMIVGLGADVAVEKDGKNTKKILMKRKKVLEDGLRSVEKQMLTVGNEMVKLESEISRLLKAVQTQKL